MEEWEGLDVRAVQSNTRSECIETNDIWRTAPLDWSTACLVWCAAAGIAGAYYPQAMRMLGPSQGTPLTAADIDRLHTRVTAVAKDINIDGHDGLAAPRVDENSWTWITSVYTVLQPSAALSDRKWEIEIYPRHAAREANARAALADRGLYTNDDILMGPFKICPQRWARNRAEWLYTEALESAAAKSLRASCSWLAEELHFAAYTDRALNRYPASAIEAELCALARKYGAVKMPLIYRYAARLMRGEHVDIQQMRYDISAGVV